jgi:hypothetical protein
MARRPGYIVHFLDNEQKRQYGRTFNSMPPVNEKIVVFYLDDTFKEVHEEKDGESVWKKRLIEKERLTVCGMCD